MSTPQAPIGSGFGAASTAAEVIADRDLTGKTVVATGGYSGIGVEDRSRLSFRRRKGCSASARFGEGEGKPGRHARRPP
jgi:hypothetical protein